MKASLVALEITVSGIVQGVGLRPFIFNLATSLELSGSVRNSGGCVIIQIEGSQQSADDFLRRLRADCPSLAELSIIEVRRLDTALDGASRKSAGLAGEEPVFRILASDDESDGFFIVPPDTAICAECESELGDPADRRHGYPFINCTQCGPRFTIIRALPYDREQTTMAAFAMCSACRKEYEDNRDRRFHAQPIACWQCGPRLSFVPKNEAATRALIEQTEQLEGPIVVHRPHAQPSIAEEPAVGPIEQALQLIRGGGILALKGLGGFQLLCDASNEQTVQHMRERKRRTGKPFAVMFPTIESVREACIVNAEEERLLVGPRRPIVLLRMKQSEHKSIAPSVANGTAWLGVMLPYTPVHSLLIKRFGAPLVATSGNHAEEPIAIDNADALIKLNTIADGFMIHNRMIESRFDDSVAAVCAGKTSIIRRARGFAPEPLILSTVPHEAGRTTLALGGHLKNTFCLLDGNRAYVSQHMGDLNNLETFSFFEETIERYQELFKLDAAVLACDLHPQYLSTELGQRMASAANIPLVRVQHHHAHITSCMAENGLAGPVIGVAFDAAGYGSDGSLWGGEFLVSRYSGFSRVGSLSSFPITAIETLSRHPWKIAVSLLESLDPQDGAQRQRLMQRYEEAHGKNAVTSLRRQINQRVTTVDTTSGGRLFDAVSSILGLCHEATFEAEAPMRLEGAALQALESGGTLLPEDYLAFQIRQKTEGSARANAVSWNAGTARKPEGSGESVKRHLTPYSEDSLDFILDSRELIEKIAAGSAVETQIPALAYAFHQALANGIVDVCKGLSSKYGLREVCLSGGVFQNRMLLELLLARLADAGLTAYTQQKLPCNDGGICLGQAIVARNFVED